MRKANRLKITPSSGNVFRDLAFSTEESEHLLIRADLLIQLQKAIGARDLTQAKAATILRVTQPRVSDLLRGRLDLFSTDTLIDMLARLGVHVRFVLKASRRRLKVARLRSRTDLPTFADNLLSPQRAKETHTVDPPRYVPAVGGSASPLARAPARRHITIPGT
jgi:predicted XRE-type DNA-binding protein